MRLFTKLVPTLALLAPLGCGSGTQSTPTTTQVATAPAPPAPPAEPPIAAADPPKEEAKPEPPAPEPAPVPSAPGTAKELGKSVQRGLKWLATHEATGGGWGQGDDAPNVRTNEPKGGANVADTSVALLAFLRAGHTPAAGEHKLAVERGLGFVLSEIEASDGDSLYVSAVRGTRVQAKIGQYVDTFAALMVLTEAKGKMKSPTENARLDAAMKKVVRKIEKNQKDNGSWDEKGWAPVLSQALAAKGMNRAAQAGAPVSKKVLERIEQQAKNGQMRSTGSAGVTLYGEATSAANVRDDASTKAVNAYKMKEAAKHAAPQPMAQSPGKTPTAAEVNAAEAEASDAMKAAVARERELVAKLSDQRFVAGFGNNGGEEYLSYLLISETLVQSRGAEWERWDAAIGKLVERVQNEDGSWVGHHCITGRTFNTAAALLVLMGDRTPVVHNTIAK
ncbi:MAG: terpene cyclase/mutase family protein [Deltaproteobacteria bacterium]|nr:terpene cyclase/mutase family protein [Deltaproteobacteria bacterium]MCW5803121.1 terpene cyclase/mutase family protein [Deltaproteobacteria bacterium]